MPDSNSAGVSLAVSRTSAGERFSRALRLYIGRGREWSCKQAERGSGVPARMIEAFLCDPTQPDWRYPGLAESLSLAKFLGPEFTAEWLRLADQGAFWLPETDDTPPGAMAADNAADNAELTRAAMDGEFDRSERPGLAIVGKRMMARGAALTKLAA